MLARLLRRRGKALAASEGFGVFNLSFKDNAESHSLVVCQRVRFCPLVQDKAGL